MNDLNHIKQNSSKETLEMNIQKCSLCIFLILFCIIQFTEQQSWNTNGDGVLEKFRNGLHMAGKILGMDTTSNVAQLINEAFKKSAPKKKSVEESGGIVGSILKMFSLDKSKISAIVINALIFLAQMISTSLTTKKSTLSETPERFKKLTDGSPLEWIMENESNHFKNLLKIAKDNNLTEKVLETIENQENISCVRQLICKISPFVKGMQKALNSGVPEKQEVDPGRNGALFRYLPELEEFKRNGEECKRQHVECRLLD